MGKGSLVLMSGQPGACPLPSLIAPTERERREIGREGHHLWRLYLSLFRMEMPKKGLERREREYFFLKDESPQLALDLSLATQSFI